MADQVLKDSRGHIIGHIKTEGGGKIIVQDMHSCKLGEIRTDSAGIKTAYDRHSVKIASYDPKLDVTKDRHSLKLGKGDLLLSLFFN